MTLKHWIKKTEEILFRNPWWIYKKDITELPNGKVGVYHYVHTNGASMVIPLLPNGKIILVNQYRYLNGRESLEFPCGGVKDGFTYLQTAIQELAEESGYKSDELVKIGEFNPYNGVTNEICQVYLASNLAPIASIPDETEEFEILHFSASEIDEKIAAGDIWDGMTITAWTLVKGKAGLLNT
jgi:ADP-ribose pyrophosphatase